MRLCTMSFLLALPLLGATATDQRLSKEFEQTVKPFLKTYCAGCHTGSKPAAQFDLSPYTSLDAVVRDHGHWAHVLDRVAAGQMPPKGMQQPSDTARTKFLTWIRDLRRSEAQKHAGDPGPVLARRLSNAEYNYTIRDLTGVDIAPAREFPVDPANTAGFDNSGESLQMSPALFSKYLQAARQVANQMALTPDGIVFAPHFMLVETDREKFAIQRIVDFYLRQPTDYATYFEVANRYRHDKRKHLPELAREAGISAKYLPLVYGFLTDSTIEDVGPVGKLRAMWRALPVPVASNQADIRKQCETMRDFVVRIRKHTAMEFAAPVVRGLSPTSQPLMNWKLKQFNEHRRDFDRAAFRSEGEAPQQPAIPRYPGLGRESAFRAAALMLKNRAGDPDLAIPADQRSRVEASFARFASVFPDAFYIKERGRFFPDDSEDKGRLLSAGYHNVMGYWRDDQPLTELVLDEKGKAELDRLWLDFEFLGDYTARTWVQYYFNQSGEVQGKGRESGTARPSDKEVSATPVIMGLRDTYLAKARADAANDPVAAQAIEEHFAKVDKTLRATEQLRVDAEPRHVAAVLAFAARAWRRPLNPAERDDLQTFYRNLRQRDGLAHEEAVRDMLVRVLMSPKFCYRADLVSDTSPASKGRTTPLSDYALASRLSYFLWSSMPDSRLLARAEKGELKNRSTLVAEVRRMLKDERARALATEFTGNWLDYRRFEQHNAVDRERFPAFTSELRQAMFEEPVRFMNDLIRSDRPVQDLLYGKHTFVNGTLAKHYGMTEVEGDEWQMIADARKFGRGGLLPMAVFLTQNSPGLRTSPVKRGYWVVRRVLGQTIPPPPPNVPELPQDESKADRPLREMLARHRDNPACASCHARFDGFGLAFENYGPVGDLRTHDLAKRPVDTQVDFPDGSKGVGYEAVLSYIRGQREQDFLDHLSRMLLSFALNRSLILSDEPLLEQMKSNLKADGYRFRALVETIVGSPQFLHRRNESVTETD